MTLTPCGTSAEDGRLARQRWRLQPSDKQPLWHREAATHLMEFLSFHFAPHTLCFSQTSWWSLSRMDTVASLVLCHVLHLPALPDTHPRATPSLTPLRCPQHDQVWLLRQGLPWENGVVTVSCTDALLGFRGAELASARWSALGVGAATPLSWPDGCPCQHTASLATELVSQSCLQREPKLQNEKAPSVEYRRFLFPQH